LFLIVPPFVTTRTIVSLRGKERNTPVVAVCTSCGAENPAGFRLCGMCGNPLVEPSPERRKLATMLFCDVVQSTRVGERLDAEAVRELMGRYSRVARSAVERHGGTVEKFAGDAVMAVFGVPVAREDDALRAIRAALELRDQVADLNRELAQTLGTTIALRTGINSGEVVAGDPVARELFVTGDAVVVAARLEASARPDEILVGERTYRLTRGAVRVEALEPVTVKGKSEPVAAYRVLGVADPVVGRPATTSFVGRADELAELTAIFDRVAAARSSELVTVIGEPGVGKSRLMEEFAGSLGDRAMVLRGRCLSYGEGVTYWPLVEALRDATATADAASADTADEIAAVLGADESARKVVSTLGPLLGASEGTSTPAQIAWATRTFLQALAESYPALLVLDDVHWAQPGLLALLDGLVARPMPAAIMLIALARPPRGRVESERPDWPTIPLRPLEHDEATKLVEHLLATTTLVEGAGQRVVTASGGNPLFAEELVAMLAEDDDLAIPETLESVLAERLDHLPASERDAAERAAVEGEVFHLGALFELTQANARADLPVAIDGLLEKELIRETDTNIPGEKAYCFRHVLIRDAAYAASAKRLRAELHEQLAGWLDGIAATRQAELEAVVGYHLEQCYRLRSQLSPANVELTALATRAAARLRGAGDRAESLGDIGAAANLYERAARLIPPEHTVRVRLLPDLARALHETGDIGRAREIVAEARILARRTNEERTAARASVTDIALSLQDTHRTARELLEELEAVLPTLEAMGDAFGLALAWNTMALVWFMRLSRAGEAEVALERALEHALRAGAVREAALARGRRCVFAARGLSTAEAIPICERMLRESEGVLDVEVRACESLAVLLGMRGRFEEGMAMFARARALRHELGQDLFATGLSMGIALLKLTAGEPLAAEIELESASQTLAPMGAHDLRSSIDAVLARAVYEQGRYAEAEDLALSSQVESHDLMTRFLAGLTLARTRARGGHADEAERIASEAIEFSQSTDWLDIQGDAELALADVLRIGGRDGDSRLHLSHALALYDRKGCTVMAERVRAQLAEPASV
jgi:class 3 adenylate cyclase/tetratricopeptide (TPR) repeat protein